MYHILKYSAHWFTHNTEMIPSADSLECPCVSTTATLPSLTTRRCILAGTGDPGVLLALWGSCVLRSYGASTCLMHNYLFNPVCRTGSPSHNNQVSKGGLGFSHHFVNVYSNTPCYGIFTWHNTLAARTRSVRHVRP